MFRPKRLLGLALTLLAVGCSSGSPAATNSPSPSASTTAAGQSHELPGPAAVTLTHDTTAYLLLDLTSVVCTPRQSCVASLPAAAALLKKARDAKAAIVYTDTPSAGSQIRPEVAPQAGEPTVSGRADKFYGTQLDQILKSKGAKTLVLAGTVANGAILYTAFEANLRGYTVVVAEDAISTDDPYVMQLTLFQLLNQPGFTNPQNKPLQPNTVTLSRSDLITFQ